MSNTVLGGGYTCSNCGKYHRTTTICNCGDRKKLPEKKAEKIPTAEEFLHKEIYYERYDRFLEKDKICKRDGHKWSSCITVYCSVCGLSQDY